jgi:hypothetical protein
MVTPAPSVGSTQLDLVRRLSAAAPTWGIWKNVASAISGSGDIDSIVQDADRGVVERAFVEWATDHGFAPVFRCDHAGDLMRVLVAVDRDRNTLVELDLTGRKTYRGSTLFTAEQIVPLLEDDVLGFRRIRAGAEGVLLFFHNGVRYGGRMDEDGLSRRNVAELLRRDPEGMTLGATLFRSAAGSARDALTSFLDGGWSRSAVARVELAFLGRAVSSPVGLARRVRFRSITKRTCPVIRVAYTAGRRLPHDVDAWLVEAAATHERLDLTDGRALSEPARDAS